MCEPLIEVSEVIDNEPNCKYESFPTPMSFERWCIASAVLRIRRMMTIVMGCIINSVHRYCNFVYGNMSIEFDEYCTCFEFGMRNFAVRCLLYSGLQSKPFDREGVFEYGHLYPLQSYVLYLRCMTDDCVHIHNHIDIYNLTCMNAYMNAYDCIVIKRYAFCINLAQVRKRLINLLLCPN